MNDLYQVANPCRQADPESLSGLVVPLLREDKILLRGLLPSQHAILREVAQISFSNLTQKVRDAGITICSPENTLKLIEILQSTEPTIQK